MKSLISPHQCKSNYPRLISEPMFFTDLIVSGRYITPVKLVYPGSAHRPLSPWARGTLICRTSREGSGVPHPRELEGALGHCALRTWASSGENRFSDSLMTRTKRLHFQTLLQSRRKCALPGNFWQFFPARAPHCLGSQWVWRVKKIPSREEEWGSSTAAHPSCRPPLEQTHPRDQARREGTGQGPQLPSLPPAAPVPGPGHCLQERPCHYHGK